LTPIQTSTHFLGGGLVMSDSTCVGRPVRHVGKSGVIHYMQTNWVNVRYDGGGKAYGVPIEEVEFLDMKTIDTTKPLRLAHYGRKATFITETSEGHILVEVDGQGWSIFDKHGKFVRAKSDGYDYRDGLENKPEIKTKFVGVDDKGNLIQGATVDYLNLQLLWDLNPEINHAIAIAVTTGDGDVKIEHRTRPK